MVGSEEFFETPEECSIVKSRIVAKYFASWARVILPSVKRRNSKLGYIDLFSGPGKYSDGSKSTPLLILNHALAEHPDLQSYLVTYFNDADKANCEKLRAELAQMDFSKFKYKPEISCSEVDASLATKFKDMKFIPSVFFIDPWGYRGLTLELINSVVKDWACETIFFFNYIRINAAITNPRLSSHAEKIFGTERLKIMQASVSKMSVPERENYVMQELVSSITKGSSERLVLQFRFWDQDKDRTSHFLVFVTKDFLGYEIMKDIMAKESIPDTNPVPSFEYVPVEQRALFAKRDIPTMEQLQSDLLARFKGKSLKMHEVYEQHTIGTPFVKKNYKQALMSLEARGAVIAEPNASSRKKDTFSDKVKVTFPT